MTSTLRQSAFAPSLLTALCYKPGDVSNRIDYRDYHL